MTISFFSSVSRAAPRRAFLWLAAAVALTLLSVFPQRGFAQQKPNEPLSITTASGAHKFSVEVMRSQAELEKGLMFRKSMPANHGMLFDFHQEKSVMMWMKNTYIPLDMIFISKAGKVVGVVADAKPMSEQILSVGTPTDAVLEVNAGTAARIGLKSGDQVQSSIFTR